MDSKQKCDILEKIISQSGGDITLIKFTLDDFFNFYLQKYKKFTDVCTRK
jgi:hypothetical protein